MANNNNTRAPIPVWLDVDTGHDDAYALLLAAHSPQLHLLGVTTVHGNASLKNTTYNTRSILEAIGRRDVPVYPGSSKPMFRDAVHAEAIHGESGLDGVTLLPEPIQAAVEEVNFMDAMYNALIGTPPKSAWFVATGTLTNVGRLLEAHPDIAEHLGGVSIMGGAVGGGFTDAVLGKVKGEGERFGNWTAFAEFNIYCDPEAAQSIFSSPILTQKTVLIPLDLTHQVLGTREVMEKLLSGPATGQDEKKRADALLPTPVRALFNQIMRFFAQTYAEVFALTEGPPLHDPLAVAAVFDPELFDDRGGERFAVTVVTEGLHSADSQQAGQVGRTLVAKLEPGQPGVRIPRSLDIPRFWDLIDLALQKAEETSPLEQLIGSSWRKSTVERN